MGIVENPTKDWTARPTIVEVAARANVSKSLASRALRSEPGVSEQKRERILQAAADLGFRLNSAARSLVSHDSGLVGVVLNDVGNPHHVQIVASIEGEARRRGLRTLIAHGAQRPEELVHKSNTLLEMQVDGLIIVSSWMPTEALTTIGAEIPTVVVAHLENPPDSVDLIASDDAIGSSAAATHLLSLGRRRIGYLTRSLSATSKARWKGIESTTTAQGAEAELISFGSVDEPAVTAVLERRQWDGIITNNDLTAAEVLRSCHELGISVPKEIALVGYDNTPLCKVLYPPLTSIDQPQTDMGVRAVERLVERRAHRGLTPLREYHRPALVNRQSSAALIYPDRSHGNK